MSSIELNFDSCSPEISCIIVPGTVEGSGRSVIRALGGEQALAQSLSGDVTTETPSTLSGCLSRSGAWASTSPTNPSPPIFLRCDPNDRYSKFLQSAISKTAGFLVKIKRDRKTNEILSIIPEGLVVTQVTFETMADFYFCPPEGVNRSNTFAVEQELSERVTKATSGPVFMPPPAFTRIVAPFNYKFEDNPFQHATKFLRQKKAAEGSNEPLAPAEAGSGVQAEESSAGASDAVGRKNVDDETSTAMVLVKQQQRKWRYEEPIFNVVCRYGDAKIPDVPCPAALAAPVDSVLLQRYEALFAERPIWFRITLDLFIEGSATISLWKKKPALAKTCFLMSDGPWRGALCRMGYDPRANPEARIYQTIDFRDPYYRTVGWRTQSATRSFAETAESTATTYPLPPPALLIPTADEIYFRAPPPRPSQLYQLCDIDDAGVKKLLKVACPAEKCSRLSGWYAKETLTKVRSLMTMTAERMRKRKGSTPMYSSRPPG